MDELEKLYTLDEVGEAFGVSYWTLWRLRRDGQLGCRLVRGCIRFTSQDVRDCINTLRNSKKRSVVKSRIPKDPEHDRAMRDIATKHPGVKIGAQN